MGKYHSMSEYVKNCFYEQRRNEIMNIEDKTQRRKEIANNMYLFDKKIEPPITEQRTYMVKTNCGDFTVNQAGEIVS